MKTRVSDYFDHVLGFDLEKEAAIKGCKLPARITVNICVEDCHAILITRDQCDKFVEEWFSNNKFLYAVPVRLRFYEPRWVAPVKVVDY